MFLLLTSPAVAQIVPDGTLGNEGSLLRSDVEVRGDLADLVEGGATRGGNLFHSFLEFNVDTEQRVYFANPVGIESILSRVTGENPSSIFGLLGVDGGADLFLLNPNGIVFGETATLDIEGSFYGTTGDGIGLGEDGVFSAVEPGSSQLLQVSPSVLLANYLTEVSGDIESRGQLAVLGDLVLAGNGLDLQGQVAAGGDLTLLGLDGVRIRDRLETPFVGFAGGDLRVQGNQQVDIVALSHPESGLFSYGDMVLRSGSPVGGDAHYWSGGGFRVEDLTKKLGNLYSPADPVILANGDVSLESYSGASLHILSGGSIIIPSITITGADAQGTSLAQNIILSNGETLSIDGSAQPTLDLRAGITWGNLLETPPENTLLDINLDSVTFEEAKTSGDIIVGNIEMLTPDGLILMTNQYEPNNIFTGDIVILEGIEAIGNGGDGSSIVIDSRNDIIISPLFGDVVINTSSASNNSGDIVFLAQQEISLLGERESNNVFIVSNTLPGALGNSGKIFMEAEDINISNAQISNSILEDGNTGRLEIRANDKLSIENSQILSTVAFGAVGNGSGISINAGSFNMSGGSQILTIVRGEDRFFPASSGNAGDIDINVTGNAYVTGEFQDGSFLAGSIIASALDSRAVGSAGTINITASDLILDRSSAIRSAIDFNAQGEAGDIQLVLDNLELRNSSGIISISAGEGDAGSVVVEASTISIKQ